MLFGTTSQPMAMLRDRLCACGLGAVFAIAWAGAVWAQAVPVHYDWFEWRFDQYTLLRQCVWLLLVVPGLYGAYVLLGPALEYFEENYWPSLSSRIERRNESISAELDRLVKYAGVQYGGIRDREDKRDFSRTLCRILAMGFRASWPVVSIMLVVCSVAIFIFVEMVHAFWAISNSTDVSWMVTNLGNAIRFFLVNAGLPLALVFCPPLILAFSQVNRAADLRPLAWLTQFLRGLKRVFFGLEKVFVVGVTLLIISALVRQVPVATAEPVTFWNMNDSFGGIWQLGLDYFRDPKAAIFDSVTEAAVPVLSGIIEVLLAFSMLFAFSILVRAVILTYKARKVCKHAQGPKHWLPRVLRGADSSDAPDLAHAREILYWKLPLLAWGLLPLVIVVHGASPIIFGLNLGYALLPFVVFPVFMLPVMLLEKEHDF